MHREDLEDQVSQLARRLIPVFAPVADGLRRTWKSALTVTLVGGVTIALVMAARALLAGSMSHLSLPSIAPLGDALRWTDVAAPPDVARTLALTTMLQLLEATAWAALGIAFISILLRYLFQSITRGPEIAVRRAVGASRRQVILSQLIEGGALAWGMLVLAIAGALAVMAWYRWSWPGASASVSLALRLPVLLALALVGIAVLTPLSYSSARFLAHPPLGHAGLRLPTFQLAVSLAVLISGAMLLRQGRLPIADNSALASTQKLVVHLDSGIANPAIRARRYDTLLDRVREQPGVQFAALSGQGELLGLGTEEFTMSDCGLCPRNDIVLPLLPFQATYHVMDPVALSSRTRLIEGRFFSTADTWDTARVVVVNRHLAERYFQNGKAIGRDIYLGAEPRQAPYTVIGIVSDSAPSTLGARLQPREVAYLPLAQHPPEQAELVVSSLGGRAVRQLVHDTLGATARVTSVRTAASVLGQEAGVIRWFAMRFGITGVVILLISLAGTFDAMRMWLRGMRHELAIRRAVGATKVRVAGWVLLRAGAAGLAGTALGIFFYLAILMPALDKLLTGVEPWDWSLVIGAAALLVTTALAGASVPLVSMLRQPVASGLEG
jgi:hypothetical protein